MYRIVRPALFALDSERAHALTLAALARGTRLNRALYARRVPASPVEAMGLRFPNPVGLAAGLDKDGTCIDGLAALGFGFLEVGTVTPRPQPGNPRPRLFRLAKHRALVNRMGFNSRGVKHLLGRLAVTGYRGVLGINIGRNFDTPPARAADDYLFCLRRVYPYASYVAINISSPNTEGLRDLQEGPALDDLLGALKRERAVLADKHGRYVPLAVKVAPDLGDAGLDTVAATVLEHGVDGVIATNTTVRRPGLENEPLAAEEGGLSGEPLRPLADAAIAGLAKRLDGAVPIIGVGGILDGNDARAKLEAGASLVQVYTGLIYRGPALVRECVQAVAGEAGHVATRDRP